MTTDLRYYRSSLLEMHISFHSICARYTCIYVLLNTVAFSIIIQYNVVNLLASSYICFYSFFWLLFSKKVIGWVVIVFSIHLSAFAWANISAERLRTFDSGRYLVYIDLDHNDSGEKGIFSFLHKHKKVAYKREIMSRKRYKTSANRDWTQKKNVRIQKMFQQLTTRLCHSKTLTSI